MWSQELKLFEKEYLKYKDYREKLQTIETQKIKTVKKKKIKT
mgnify:FL=1